MSVRRASDSLKSSIARKLCLKHPERIATHQLVNKGPAVDSYYCEKCSIMLASQGYNVIKLNAINPMAHNTIKRNSVGHKSERASINKRNYSIISNRKNQISSFVEGLDNLHFQLQRKNEYIQDCLIKSENQHGQMIEDANRFYKELEQLIELQKYTTYNSILSKRTLEQAEIRQVRNSVIEALQQIEAMMNDIRENMEAVESVDYNIYNTIMGGYQSKIDKVKCLTKQNIQFKPQQKCFLILPQIPKQLYTLSDKISISFQHKSNTTTNQNSMNMGFKPQRIVTQQDICISDQSQNSNQNIDYINKENIPIQKHLDEPQINMKQILRTHGNMKELAFSFDQNANYSKQLRINEDENFLGTSKYQIFKGFQQGKLSKIEQRLHSKEVCESRQSLGEYLDISQSRQRNNSLEDHQTLLLA